MILLSLPLRANELAIGIVNWPVDVETFNLNVVEAVDLENIDN